MKVSPILTFYLTAVQFKMKTTEMGSESGNSEAAKTLCIAEGTVELTVE